MNTIDNRQQKILDILSRKEPLSSSIVREELLSMRENISLVTVKRNLSEMAENGLLIVSGSGRSTTYIISMVGRVFLEVDAEKYCAIEPDKRYGQTLYNFDLLSKFPLDIFTDNELRRLDNATRIYNERTKNVSPAVQKKELERLVIELSWKSSRIEGNTYTLLDTEKLILENKEAPGHDKSEAQMILNHKDAFNFIHEHADQFETLTRANLEHIHSILIKNLSVNMGLRTRPVGVVGSKYKPLDNIYQITEAVNILSALISHISNPLAKALVALLGISYIQPFEDGNKRTGRLMANALLLAYHHAPLSYRSIDETNYREAMLVFYELNSIMPFKNIFIEQYEFAAQNYVVK